MFHKFLSGSILLSNVRTTENIEKYSLSNIIWESCYCALLFMVINFTGFLPSIFLCSSGMQFCLYVIRKSGITITPSWARWRLKSLGPQLFAERLFRRRSKKTTKLRVIGLCEGNPSVGGGFPSQRANNAKNDSIWWRHSTSVNYCQLSNPDGI